MNISSVTHPKVKFDHIFLSLPIKKIPLGLEVMYYIQRPILGIFLCQYCLTQRKSLVLC